MASLSSDFGSPAWHLLLHSFSFPLPSFPPCNCPFATAFQELISFGIILTTSFYNISWTKKIKAQRGWMSYRPMLGAARLVLSFTCSLGLRGNVSNEELKEMETIFYRYSIRTISICHNHVSNRQFECDVQFPVVGMELTDTCVSLSSFFLWEMNSTFF